MKKSEELQQQAAATTADPRWASIVARDKNADGAFFYSVKTTGVFCRPSCGEKLPRPENVKFYSTTEEAERAGFRPCKRCKPTGLSLAEANTAKIARVCSRIENAEEPRSLEELARIAGMSTFHFHRTFKAVTGLTPNEYAEAHRSKRVRETLAKGQSITDVIYDAGYSSSSRFYESSTGMLGMTPSDFRSGGKDTMIHFAVGECSLGSILVATSDRGVCAVLLGDDPDTLARNLQDQFPRAELIGNESGYEKLVAKVVGLIEQPGAAIDLPLDIRGTVFQRRVWKALQEIPAGTTVSYTDIAKQIGKPRAVRAVAQACASNSIAVAIPCHRVVKSDGALSGYRWGVERKQILLDREATA